MIAVDRRPRRELRAYRGCFAGLPSSSRHCTNAVSSRAAGAAVRVFLL